SGCGVTRFFKSFQVGGTSGTPPVACESFLCVSTIVSITGLDLVTSHDRLNFRGPKKYHGRFIEKTPSPPSTPCANHGIALLNGSNFSSKSLIRSTSDLADAPPPSFFFLTRLATRFGKPPSSIQK